MVDKPSGLLSIPGRSVEDSVQIRIPLMIPGAHGPIVAHRLDRDTSGLMVVGLTPQDHRVLSMEFAQGRVTKIYQALVSRVPKESRGTVSLRTRLDPDNRPRQVVDPKRGRLGITQWRISAKDRLELIPEHGRTHQLRVHLSVGLGCPIVGDTLYGGAPAERLMLHACVLDFCPPRSGRRVQVGSHCPF